MPCTRDKKDVNGNKILDKNGKPKQEMYAFKLGTVFETHQLVEYENLPKPVAYVPDNPDDNRKLFFSITKASDVPIKVLETTEMCSGANGFYSPTTKEICLSPDLKGYQRIKTLLHEITHSKLHKDSQEVFGSEKYALQELEAESTAFVVANHLNIDTKDLSIIAEKQNNQKQVLTVNDLEKRKVVEHNSLITSIAKMQKTALKMFELAVSCIDTENPPKDNIIYLSKKELFSFFDVSSTSKHTRFKEAIEFMQKQAFFQIKEEKNKGYEMTSIVPIPTVKWNSYNDDVMIQFNQFIMPYLIDLKAEFTQYKISELKELNSKYSIILYRWLSMNYNQYEHYSVKGGRRMEQVEAYRNPSISVKELREITDTVSLYQTFKDFDSYVLKNSLKEINAYTSFNVTYEKVKKGRSIDSIVFHIEKKRQADDNSYKLEDQASIEGKKAKEETEKDLYTEAMQSRYTTLLLENMLLSPFEMQDIKLMSGLQAHVYPLYDELKEARGLNGLKTHLSYIASKQEGYSKRNVVKYLKTAIESYLATIALQDVEQPERASVRGKREIHE